MFYYYITALLLVFVSFAVYLILYYYKKKCRAQWKREKLDYMDSVNLAAGEEIKAGDMVAIDCETGQARKIRNKQYIDDDREVIGVVENDS